MSLKNVELQVALPRTLEVTRIQDQLLQRGVHEQQSLMEERSQLDQQMRQRPTDVSHTEKNRIREREQKQKNKQQDPNMSSASPEGEGADDDVKRKQVSMRDPLRGRFIDISL